MSSKAKGEFAIPDKIEHADLLELTEKQNLALLEIVRGATDSDAAKAAGVDRSTVNGWRNCNPAFRAAIRNHRAEIWATTKKPLVDAISAAMLTIGTAIKNGDASSAWRLLEKVGIEEVLKTEIEGMKEAPTTPEREAQYLAAERELQMQRLARQEAALRVQELGGDPFDAMVNGVEDKFFAEELRALKKAEAKKKV